MCVHSVEDFLEEFPDYSRREVDQAISDLMKAFPDIPEDRLGEAVVMCLAGENPEMWSTFSDDIGHYWELFVQRSARDVLECPHESPIDVEKWLLGRLDALSLMMWEATRKGIGRAEADQMMRQACAAAFVSCSVFMEMSTDGIVN